MRFRERKPFESVARGDLPQGIFPEPVEGFSLSKAATATASKGILND
jgi:hypothetical protein